MANHYEPLSNLKVRIYLVGNRMMT